MNIKERKKLVKKINSLLNKILNNWKKINIILRRNKYVFDKNYTNLKLINKKT